MIERKCDWCGSKIPKPIAANGATIHTSLKGRGFTKHFCEGCMKGKYKDLVDWKVM